MALVAVGLYAILTSAQDVMYDGESNSYVECFNNSDCLKTSEKIYCYAGTCTDRCPPGYSQVSTGAPPYFTCECNTKRGFGVNGHFNGTWSGVQIPKCNCTKSYCEIMVYAKGIGYTDGIVPKGSPPNCKYKTEPNLLSSFTLYMLVGTMLVFTFLNCRSSSSVIYDFHRYIAIYAVASIAVIVFVQTVYPFIAGFTRTMAFGVIIHNSAEWNLILRLHFGKSAFVRSATNMCVMFYYVLLLILMIALPLNILLLIAMIQGGFLDWALLFFTIVGYRNITQEANWQPLCGKYLQTSSSRFCFTFGIAAFFHLATVEILFVGFAMNYPAVSGLGSLLLVPTFFLYTYFAYGEDRLSVLFGPSLVLNYKNGGDKDSDSYTLTTFEHTSRAVDILWEKVYSSPGITKKMAAVADTSNEAGDDNETSKLIKLSNDVDVEDCENFKFGVDAKTCLFGKCHPLLAWVPCYWLCAFLIVTLNATLIILAPDFLVRRPSDCSIGFEYGAW